MRKSLSGLRLEHSMSSSKPTLSRPRSSMGHTSSRAASPSRSSTRPTTRRSRSPSSTTRSTADSSESTTPRPRRSRFVTARTNSPSWRRRASTTFHSRIRTHSERWPSRTNRSTRRRLRVPRVSSRPPAAASPVLRANRFGCKLETTAWEWRRAETSVPRKSPLRAATIHMVELSSGL